MDKHTDVIVVGGGIIGLACAHYLLEQNVSVRIVEREVIGERIRDKVAATKRKGKYCGGMPVLGYDVDREQKRLVVNLEEAELVRHIFTRFVETGSTTELAKELNAAGYRTKSWVTKKGSRHEGVAWNLGHIYRLLNNALYIGEVTHRGKRYPGEHDPIVPRRLWEQAHAILARNYRARGAQTRTKTTALLRGIIRCAHCDRGMGPTYTRRRGKMYRYYLCVGAAKNGRDECPVRTVPAGDVGGSGRRQRAQQTVESCAETATPGTSC